MTRTRFVTLQRNRTIAWSKVGPLLACLLIALGLFAAGCGGESSDTDTTATTAIQTQEPASTTAGASAMSGSELGEAAGVTWAEAMQELNALLADRPDPAVVTPQVEELKEEHVQRLVELGRQKEALDDAGKAEMNAVIASALSSSSGEEWYAIYQEIYSSYASEDAEFANLLVSFNILTQYADFDLLKQQEPEEAARLGIE